MTTTNFSVLLSVYSKEDPVYLKQALNSIWNHQTLKPSEIIIVKDGPLTLELDKVVNLFSLLAPVKIVALKENMGLGIALSHGINACSNEFIARMDSDDISYPNRFEKQIPLMQKGYDVVSSWSIFFENSIDNIIATKERPEHHKEIIKLAKKRSPVCHPCSIIRKSKVLEAGNYRHFLFYEDYDLWVRMIMKDAKFYNLQDYIYYVRGSQSQFGRRGGLAYFKTEVKAHWSFKKSGFLSLFEFIRNIFIRFFIRLAPTFIRRKILLLIWNKLTKNEK